MRFIVTEGYYSGHDTLGILDIQKGHVRKAKKEIADFVTNMERREPQLNATNLDEIIKNKIAHEERLLGELGFTDEDRPSKLEVMKRILEKNDIPYTFEVCDEISLGDYWGW